MNTVFPTAAVPFARVTAVLPLTLETPAPHATVTPIPPRRSTTSAAPSRPRLSREALDAIAKAEIAWLHSDASRSEHPKVVPARRTIQAWVSQLPVHQRAAIALYYSRRSFSPTLDAFTKPAAAILVRLDCMGHPALLSKETHEKAAVARIEERVRSGKGLGWLQYEAEEFLDRATRAYRKVRGEVPSVIPTEVEWTELEVDV